MVRYRGYSEMAKRASEKSFFDGDEPEESMSNVARYDSGIDSGGGGGSMGAGDTGGGGMGGGEGGQGDSLAPRKSFVMKRGWGTMKMVEVRE